MHARRRTGIPRTSLCKKLSCWSFLTSVSEFKILLTHVLHCGSVSPRRGVCFTTRSPHYGYEPQQRSVPGNMHLQNNMTPRFHDGCHVQGQARTMKSTRLCTFMQKGIFFSSGPLGKHFHSACDARPIRGQVHTKSAGGSFARVPLWVAIRVAWNPAVRVGGVLYFMFFRWSPFLHPLFTVESFPIPF